MARQNNSTCSICGAEYHVCSTCNETKTYTPWRIIVDTIEHYKIFMIIRDYNNGYMSKKEASKELRKLDLTELNTFVSEVKHKINEILEEEIDSNKISEVTKEEKVFEDVEDIKHNLSKTSKAKNRKK